MNKGLGHADGKISLPDGRSLGVALYGDRSGWPVVYCHGFPGSRLEACMAHQICEELGMLLVGVDRPGYGLSPNHPGMRIVDFPEDVEALLDELGVERASVLGVSGGGPYALACGWSLKGRICSVALVGSIGPPECPARRALDPLNRLGLEAARRAPWVFRLTLGGLAPILRASGWWVVLLVAMRVAPKDRRVLLGSPLGERLAVSFREAFGQAGSGPSRDAALYGQPWGFSLKEVQVPVFIWHGKQDRIVPWEMGEWLSKALPRSVLRILPTDGHFSLAMNRAGEIFQALKPQGPCAGHGSPFAKSVAAGNIVAWKRGDGIPSWGLGELTLFKEVGR